MKAILAFYNFFKSKVWLIFALLFTYSWIKIKSDIGVTMKLNLCFSANFYLSLTCVQLWIKNGIQIDCFLRWRWGESAWRSTYYLPRPGSPSTASIACTAVTTLGIPEDKVWGYGQGVSPAPPQKVSRFNKDNRLITRWSSISARAFARKNWGPRVSDNR